MNYSDETIDRVIADKADEDPHWIAIVAVLFKWVCYIIAYFNFLLWVLQP